ncbi:MAG: 4Fe-4S dicluster domain-containing protein [Clostridiales bacterium]|nr:4Fe-4S dicluster domain-containing protein [Clostridiales bacterium]
MAYLGENIKKLGFGLMRLPMIGGMDGDIDIAQVKDMVDLFMAKGFTYFDTAYGYANGKSEAAAKTALVDRYPRESFQLATKLPAWAGPKTADEAKQMFWTSLERTGAGYFDFYLLHNCGGGRTAVFDNFGIWDYVRELKQKGFVKHIGFSFHDTADELDRILTAHPDMEFVQLQLNYGDWESGSVQSRKCYEVALKHNKPIIIMEPVKGGSLANLPDRVGNILKEADPKASQASWAIRFAASLDNVITVLSGMSTLEQMKDNLSYMENFKPLNAEEKTVVEKARQILMDIPQVPCTSCAYCVEGCPQGIHIPQMFDAMNRYLVYDDLNAAKFACGLEQMFGSKKASECIACGACEAVCPQKIQIIDELKRVAETLE